PLFATFLLGMFWTRATGDGAFWGLLCGTIGAGLTEALTVAEGQGGWLGSLHVFPSQMAQNFWISIVSWTICFVMTIVVSLMTEPYPRERLVGLVHGVTELPDESGTQWYRRPVVLAVAVGLVVIGLNLWFH
ncbi:MAG TPA: Na+/galactose cotransporter, partial [Bryobacteraceae bacterium]|nr:Na+/galactose cotransporter [Bryobacteraceae bacterium]